MISIGAKLKNTIHFNCITLSIQVLSQKVKVNIIYLIHELHGYMRFNLAPIVAQEQTSMYITTLLTCLKKWPPILCNIIRMRIEN